MEFASSARALHSQPVHLVNGLAVHATASGRGHRYMMPVSAYILFSASERHPIPSVPDLNLEDGYSLQKSQQIVPQAVHHNRDRKCGESLQTRGDHAPDDHPTTRICAIESLALQLYFPNSDLESRNRLCDPERVQLGLRKVIQTQAWACHSTLFSQMRP